MATKRFSKEEFNFFKFASITHDEFPKMLRSIFVRLWNTKIAPLPGYYEWDDSHEVRQLFLACEGGKTNIPTNKSFDDWDCTALFQATIFSNAFGISTKSPTTRKTPTIKTLSDQFIKGTKPSPFHLSLISPTGNQDETIALAIDQVRLLRNRLCLSPVCSIEKVDFEHYVRLAKEAFDAVKFPTSQIDEIGILDEEHFPTDKFYKLSKKIVLDLQGSNKFLQEKLETIITTHVDESKVFQESVLQKLDKMEKSTKGQDRKTATYPRKRGALAIRALCSGVSSDGRDFLFRITADHVKVNENDNATLGELFHAWEIIHPSLPQNAVRRGLGDESADQKVGEVKTGSLLVPLHCFTDERFLKVLDDFESGRLKESLLEKFSLISFQVKGIRIEIMNMEQIKNVKGAIKKRIKQNNDVNERQGAEEEGSVEGLHLCDNTAILPKKNNQNPQISNEQPLGENNEMSRETSQHQMRAMPHFPIEERRVVVLTGDVLGRGFWSTVYTGDFHGSKVAVKEYHELIISPNNLEFLQREINIASQSRHPNLLQFICAMRNDQNRLLIVTELMDMTLRTLIERHDKYGSWLEYEELRLISLDVACGLNYLHSMKPNPIIHRDISSANVLLQIENHSPRRAKISNYGSAKFMDTCRCETSNPEATLYAAPEVAQGEQDPKIDVFSYGILVCEIAICKRPVPENRSRQRKSISNKNVRKLVKSCTKPEPRERPTMQDVIENWQHNLPEDADTIKNTTFVRSNKTTSLENQSRDHPTSRIVGCQPLFRRNTRRLEHENSQLQNENQELRQKIDRMNTEFQELLEDRKQGREEVKALRQKNVDNSREIRELRKVVDDIHVTEKEKSFLSLQIQNEKMERFLQENLDKSNKIKQLQKEKKELSNEVKETRYKDRKIQELLKEKGQMGKKIEQLTGECANEISLKEHEIEHLKRDKQALENEIHKQFRYRIEQMNNEIQQLQRDKNVMSNEIQRLQEEGNEMSQEIQQRRGDKNKMSYGIQQLEKEKNEMRSKIQKHRDRIHQMENEINQHHREKNAMSNKIQQLQKENYEMRNEIPIRLAEKNKMEYDIRQLQKEKDEMKDDIQQSGDSIDQMNNEILQHQGEKNAMINEIQRLQEERNEMSDEIHQLQYNINDMRNEIQLLQKYIDKMTLRSMFRFPIDECAVVVSTNDVLGRGTYGAVYKGEFHGSKVAVKEYHEVIISDCNLQILQREVYIASQCRHPNLLQFICATRNDQNRLLIVTELMDMTLRTFVVRHARAELRLEYQELRLISLDVARGLNYLHSKKPNPIVHRDISSANVLLEIGNRSTRRAKISDYGSANFMDICKTMNLAALYAAPEAEHSTQDPKIDVFSYGILVCEMSICQLPEHEDRENQRKSISNKNVKQLVKACTKPDPRARPTMQDVIENWQLNMSEDTGSDSLMRSSRLFTV